MPKKMHKVKAIYYNLATYVIKYCLSASFGAFIKKCTIRSNIGA